MTQKGKKNGNKTETRRNIFRKKELENLNKTLFSYENRKFTCEFLITGTVNVTSKMHWKTRALVECFSHSLNLLMTRGTCGEVRKSNGMGQRSGLKGKTAGSGQVAGSLASRGGGG